MAELEIKSKVTLKYDTYSKWMASSLILKKGEIAIAELIQDDQETGLTPPTVGIKVGDGTKTFSKLPWIQAVAGDIYAWAKAKNKPTYEAEEIQNLQQFILTNVTDKNTTYQIVTTDEGHSYKLQKKDIEDEGFSDVDGSTVNLESIYTQLSSLQTKIEDIDVTEQIEAALTDLNYLDAAKSHEFVTAVNEANGKIDVTRASLTKEDIPTIEQSQVNGLTDALAGKQNTLVFGTAYNSESNKAATQTDIQVAIEEKLNDVGIKKEVVEELPDVKQMKDGVLYLVKRAAEKEKNIYDEYILINGAIELIGNTETDLSGYAKTEDLKWENITSRPTQLSQFTNDEDFIASTEVDTKIEQKRFKTQIAESIPQPEQMQDNIMYLVKTSDFEGKPIYDEYILVNNTAELVGSHIKEEDIENLIIGSMTFEIKQDSPQWESVQDGLYKTEITLSDNFSNLKNIAVVADVLQGADETENQTLRNDWPNVVRITYEDSTLTVYATKELTKLHIQLLVFKVGFTGNESFDLNNFVQKDQIANDVEPGLVKILDTIGQATDATMSQKAISDELAKANGIVGDYYYPTVDDAGNLSWELKTSSEVSELPATKSIRGPAGENGAPGKEGPAGPAGEAGRGILSAEITDDYKLKLNYTDSTSFTSEVSIRGPQGDAGATGAAGPAGAVGPAGPAGKGISSVELQEDYTLKFTYTDQTSTTTTSVRGADGSPGAAGPQGPAGAAGAQGPAGPNLVSTETATSGLTGLIKASGNKIAQAVPGVDYVPPTITVNGQPLSGNVTISAPKITISNVDITPGVTPLEEGEIYLVYEE